jgi:hypothetical protein
MGGIQFGFEFVIGAVIAILIVFVILRQARILYYNTVGRDRMPPDIKNRLFLSSVKTLDRRLPKMTKEQRDSEFNAIMLALTTVTDLYPSTRNELVKAAGKIAKYGKAE